MLKYNISIIESEWLVVACVSSVSNSQLMLDHQSHGQGQQQQGQAGQQGRAEDYQVPREEVTGQTTHIRPGHPLTTHPLHRPITRTKVATLN